VASYGFLRYNIYEVLLTLGTHQDKQKCARGNLKHVYGSLKVPAQVWEIGTKCLKD
jgi:hypothetical protein